MVRQTWEPEIAQLISNMVQKNKNEGRNTPIIVSVVGMPGSGKTTSSGILGSILQETHEISCTVLPMDGYHFSIAQLKAMENPEDVIYRRGAPDTFDANSLRKDLSRIRHGDETQVFIPGFDHKIGDPNPNEHVFKRSIHDVVIIEGLYLLLEKEKFGWTGIKVRRGCIIRQYKYHQLKSLKFILIYIQSCIYRNFLISQYILNQILKTVSKD